MVMQTIHGPLCGCPVIPARYPGAAMAAQNFTVAVHGFAPDGTEIPLSQAYQGISLRLAITGGTPLGSASVVISGPMGSINDSVNFGPTGEGFYDYTPPLLGAYSVAVATGGFLGLGSGNASASFTAQPAPLTPTIGPTGFGEISLPFLGSGLPDQGLQGTPNQPNPNDPLSISGGNSILDSVGGIISGTSNTLSNNLGTNLANDLTGLGTALGEAVANAAAPITKAAGTGLGELTSGLMPVLLVLVGGIILLGNTKFGDKAGGSIRG
jgi:hypothetical protein